MIFGTLQTVLAFVVTLGILVSIHEFGHFWVARWCGVRVLRFSVGFGKSLWSRTDKRGTEFSVAAIPLGGYVKMLDEREAPVDAREKHLSFNSQSVLSRIAIVGAGPLANFLLAIAALWLMYMVGVRTLIPQVGEVLPDSPVAVAGLQPGDEIVAVDGEETPGWQAVNIELLSSIGETGVITLSVKSGEPGHAATGPVRDHRIKIESWLTGDEQPDPVRALGIVPFTPDIPAVIGHLVEEGAAKQAGFESGDKIIRANSQPVEDWKHWVDIIRANPGQSIDVVFERDGSLQDIALTPGSREVDGEVSGYIGAGVQQVSWPDEMVRTIQHGPLTALAKGAKATWSLTRMTVE